MVSNDKNIDDPQKSHIINYRDLEIGVDNAIKKASPELFSELFRNRTPKGCKYIQKIAEDRLSELVILFNMIIFIAAIAVSFTVPFITTKEGIIGYFVGVIILIFVIILRHYYWKPKYKACRRIILYAEQRLLEGSVEPKPQQEINNITSNTQGNPISMELNVNNIFNKLKSIEETQREEIIYWSKMLIPILIIIIFSFYYSVEFSHGWVYEHISKDSYEFVANQHATGNVNYKNLNYAINYTAYFTAIDDLEVKIQESNKLSNVYLYIIIIFYLIILLLTIFTAIKHKVVETCLDRDYENSLISTIGVFLGIGFGLASGAYLLLISLRKDYLTQLLLLISQRVPYENLPFISWDASYQTLSISYIGFEIISILLLTSLLLRIGYIKSNYKEFKRGSNAYLLLAIFLSIEVFIVFTQLDKFW